MGLETLDAGERRRLPREDAAPPEGALPLGAESISSQVLARRKVRTERPAEKRAAPPVGRQWLGHYPRGSNNVYRAYDGADGVPIGGIARRALFAWYFGDVNILLSEYITAESRVMFRRNIQERVHQIASFLRLDKDPLQHRRQRRAALLDQDAYTTSSGFRMPSRSRTTQPTANSPMQNIL